MKPYFLYVIIYIPENLYPKFPSAPSISQESFNIETIRKYYQNIIDLKNKYDEKQWKYRNACTRLLNASTAAAHLLLIRITRL